MGPDVDETDPRMPDLMISWPWPQMSTKPIPGCSIWWLPGHGSRCRRNRSQDARPWAQMSTKPMPGSPIWWFPGHGPRCRWNRSQDARFNDLLAMAPDVDGTDPQQAQPGQPTQAANPTLSIGSNIGSNIESNGESSIGSSNESYIESIQYWIQWWIQYSIQYWKRSSKAYVKDFTSRKIMTGDLYHLNFLLFN